MTLQIAIDHDRVAAFCEKWKVKELSLFGSVLRDDFRSDSDVDVLVKFSEDARWDLFDWVEIKDDLEDIFGRSVDLVEEAGLRNPYRRERILSTKQVILAS